MYADCGIKIGVGRAPDGGRSRSGWLRVDQIFGHEWTTAGILEAAKGFPRLKAYKHLPALGAALAAHQSKCVSKRVEDNADVA